MVTKKKTSTKRAPRKARRKVTPMAVNKHLAQAGLTDQTNVISNGEQLTQALARLRMANTLMAANATSTGATSSRATLAQRAGYHYGTDRDLYTALGFPTSIVFDTYFAHYSRQGYAKRVVDAFPNSCWMARPEVWDVPEADIESPFEQDWKSLVKKRRVWHYLKRADRLAGVGSHGALFLGFDDGKEFSEPCTAAKDLLYMTPLMENKVEVASTVSDTTDERCGLPETYRLQFENNKPAEVVHWTRVLHVADNVVDSDSVGTPRMQPVFNNLLCLERLTGGSAEMFWRGAFPGLGFVLDSDANVDSKDMTKLEEEIEKYIHGVNRFMKLQGLDIEQLAPQIEDPEGHVNAQLMEMSAATGIPKRILTGSEEAQLAGAQDTESWKRVVDERRTDFCEDVMLRPFIDRLVKVGVLSKPKDGEYTVDWPDVMELTPKDATEIALKRTEALVKYVTSGAEAIMPPDKFLELVWDLDADELKELAEYFDERMEEEQRHQEEEDAARAESLKNLEKANKTKNLPGEEDEEEEEEE